MKQLRGLYNFCFSFFVLKRLSNAETQQTAMQKEGSHQDSGLIKANRNIKQVSQQKQIRKRKNHGIQQASGHIDKINKRYIMSYVRVGHFIRVRKNQDMLSIQPIFNFCGDGRRHGRLCIQRRPKCPAASNTEVEACIWA